MSYIYCSINDHRFENKIMTEPPSAGTADAVNPLADAVKDLCSHRSRAWSVWPAEKPMEEKHCASQVMSATLEPCVISSERTAGCRWRGNESGRVTGVVERETRSQDGNP